jgi:hypothetical protein
MAKKLYVDGGVNAARFAQKYLTRWQSKMIADATPDQIATLADLIACIANFLSKWHKSTPVN